MIFRVGKVKNFGIKRWKFDWELKFEMMKLAVFALLLVILAVCQAAPAEKWVFFANLEDFELENVNFRVGLLIPQSKFFTQNSKHFLVEFVA
jgi:hypothetical protein